MVHISSVRILIFLFTVLWSYYYLLAGLGSIKDKIVSFILHHNINFKTSSIMKHFTLVYRLSYFARRYKILLLQMFVLSTKNRKSNQQQSHNSLRLV